MSNRRKLRSPAHIAAADQAFAHAREIAKDPKVGAVVLDLARDGQVCSWCDCPPGPDNPHDVPNYQCGGCPREADVAVHVMVGRPEYSVFPICYGHLPGLQWMLADLTGSPIEVQQYPS